VSAAAKWSRCHSQRGVSAAALAAAPPIASADAVGERRYLTVMFCDLVGSTAISAQLDAEEWRDLVGAYLDAASARSLSRAGAFLLPNVVAFPQLSPQKSRHRPKKQHNSDKNQFRLLASGTLPRLSVFVRCAVAVWWGFP
jgi:class 3 adenylate cyclase